MPRPRRIVPAGHVYHVLNRACERRQIFRTPEQYRSFLGLLARASRRIPMRICAYCLMPNHWHLLVWPEQDGAVSAYLHWVTTMHSLQYRRSGGDVGYGHVYQDRYHCFPVETARYYYQVVRYIETNPLRAGLVRRAELWEWSSAAERGPNGWLVTPGPLALPDDWLHLINSAPADDELDAIRVSSRSDRPYGSPEWVIRTAAEQGLNQRLRTRGRPRSGEWIDGPLEMRLP